MTKKEQRLAIRERLSHFSEAERAAASQVITAKVAALPEFRAAKVVALYANLASEPATRALFQTTTCQVVFPRVKAESWQIDFYQVRAWEELKPGKFDVLEPDPERCAKVNLDEINFILVPGVAFDRNGMRLGRGGGFYDRLLAALPRRARRVGVFFSCQESTQLPHEPHDEPLDLIITELS